MLALIDLRQGLGNWTGLTIIREPRRPGQDVFLTLELPTPSEPVLEPNRGLGLAS